MYSIMLRIIVGHYVNSPPNKRFYCIDGFHSDFDLVPRKPISSSFLSLIPWKSKRTLLKPCVFYRKVIENNGPLHFHEYNLFFRGAQVLCRQQFAFHLCDGVPAKSGAWTLPSAHAWTRWAMDLTKSGLLSLVRLDRVYPKTWDWPNCYAFFSFLVEILLHLFRVQEFEHLGLATWPVWWLEVPSKPIGAGGSRKAYS